MAKIERYVYEPPAKKEAKVLDQKQVSCHNCGPLLDLVKIRDSNKQNQYQAKCLNCGETSFIVKIDGDVIISPTEGKSIINPASTQTGNITFNLVEIQWSKK